tara:strand:- start:32 stop:193 length:162 start_codon:yes stop_codon:yes gene_type:complete
MLDTELNSFCVTQFNSDESPKTSDLLNKVVLRYSIFKLLRKQLNFFEIDLAQK